MRSVIKLFSNNQAVEVKETYQTLKRRLNDSGLFFEANDKLGKLTISKQAVEWVSENNPARNAQPKTEPKKTVKK